MIGARQNGGVAGAYRAVEGIGAPPEDFMKMALDATRNLLLRAEAAITANERVEKAQALSSAGSVVEFLLGLSGSAPGALSECLASVYQYVLAAILKGNAGDDMEAVAAARVALDELAATWRTIFPDTIVWEENGPDSALSGRRDYA
ncbi:MAG TPA: flagellar protein FliS [Stellaceae bacterium]|jgi:flagellar protein FliS|nr:flagellar protein FliS [Stellaceae bacterium]